MKKCLFLLLCAIPCTMIAQQNAIIKVRSKTAVDNNGAGQNTELSRTMIQTMSEFVETTIYIKDSLRKVVMKNDRITTTFIYDERTGTATTLRNASGKKMGYTQNAAQRAEQIARSNAELSEIRTRANAWSATRINRPVETVDIAYTSKEKVINGFNCKKAMVTSLNAVGDKRLTEVWYTNDYSLKGNIMVSQNAFDLSGINGVVIKYKDTSTMAIQRDEVLLISQYYDVKNIDTVTVIDDKEFEIPADYTMTTWEVFIKENPQGLSQTRHISTSAANKSRGITSLVPISSRPQ